MEIEDSRFVELAVHVKLASEAVLEAARNLSTLESDRTDAGAWRRAMDELLSLNVQLAFMERILRASIATTAVPPSRARSLARP
ncbi:MAG TPA: hypothetical protein VKA21_16440 [Candidatus Binatia bacterium]|nr:hypothetical protein [Candidatus Binatia bacterium]